jgi:hypothetical protein
MMLMMSIALSSPMSRVQVSPLLTLMLSYGPEYKAFEHFSVWLHGGALVGVQAMNHKIH